MSLYKTFSTTISSGTTTDEINLGNRILVGVHIPASVSSTDMKISGATNAGGTFSNVYDGDGLYGTVGDYNPAIAASKYIPIPPSLTVGLTDVKLIFGASETSKTYTIVTREIQ